MIYLLIIFTNIFTQNGTFVVIYLLKKKIYQLFFQPIIY